MLCVPILLKSELKVPHLLQVSVQVDVVGAEGGKWVRVFCRKRSALHRRWLGTYTCILHYIQHRSIIYA